VVSTTPLWAAVILPKEGAELNYLHVPFRWAEVDFSGDPTALYQLILVEDNGSEDPFSGAPVVLNVITSGAEPPRTVVTSGLEFDKAYAWHVRGFLYDPMPWGPTHRFSTIALPDYLPTFPVTIPEGGGSIEPGLTLFNLKGIPGGAVVAVDQSGAPVLVMTWSGRTGGATRLLDTGRLLFISPPRAWETTLSGQVVWATPGDGIHHDAYPMPNGNILALLRDVREVEVEPGVIQSWKGHQYREYQRRTNQIVWQWSEWDHYSTLDYDPTMMEAPGNDGNYDWTHSNAVLYSEADNSVYVSPRHLSRITRIDYDTGDVIYNMGFDMPSGDADFGDNLFSFQHAPELLPNGNMMVYDNGNRRDHIVHTEETGVSKAIELEFSGGDPPTSASIVWEYTMPVYQASGGDADRLPGGNTLCTASVEGKVYEVDPSGDQVWIMEAAGPNAPYRVPRADRIPELIVDTPGDTDGDWDLDLLDFARFQTCFTGEGPAGLEFPCTLSDIDEDDDVDLHDLAEFVRMVTGPV
jgi:hypothetical protein